MKNGKKAPRLSSLAAVVAGVAVVGMAALWLASCNADIKGTSTKRPTSPSSPVAPRLAAIELETPFVLSPSFSPAIFTYSVAIQSETNPVNINATPEVGFFVEFPLGQQVTPLNGNVAIVNAYDAAGLKTNYYIQFVKDELPKAKLSSVMLSAGSVAGFSKEETVYNNIAVPFGVQSVTVFPAGDQDGSYFTFPNTASVTLNASGTGTVTVGVIANGYSQNEYTFNFKRDQGGQPSELGTAGIALSGGGALAAAFDQLAGTEQTIIVPYNTTELTVIAVKKNWKDTVHFDDDQPSDSKIFTGNLQGVQFSITVNCGIAYTDKTYQFKIQKSTETPAVVSALNFKINNAPVTVYQRTAVAGGAAPLEGFDSAYNLYNFNFAHSAAHGTASAEISAQAESGAVITVLSGADTEISDGSSVTIPFAELASSHEPVQLRVSAAGKAPNTYTIYFKKTNPPLARLNSVTITGIAGAQPNIAGGAGTYPVDMNANAQFVVVNTDVPVDYDYEVRYETWQGEAHNYLLSPYISGGYIKVYISGGDDYAESIYRFNFTALTPLLPRLTSLSVGGSSLITSVGHDILVYTKNVVYSSGPTNIPFTWTVDPGVVSKVQYLLESGTSWQSGGVPNFPSTTLFAIAPSQSKVTFLKVTTLDGAEAVYNITVTKAGDSTNQLSSIAVTAPAGAVLQQPDGTTGFDGAVFNYTVLIGSTTTSASVDISWPAGDSVVRYTLDGVSDTLPGTGTPAAAASITVPFNGTQKLLTIMIHPQAGAAAANTYIVVFAYVPPIVFNATGSVQTFTAPYTGRYRIECWGAQGGNSDSGGLGGMGGYSYGTKTLAKDAVLYVYAGTKGGNGTNSAYGTGGWNGGGNGGNGWNRLDQIRIKGAAGGGASDVRTASGLWNANFGTRIIVAGGGGGAGHSLSGGGGGGGRSAPNCNGGDGTSPGLLSPGATQSSTATAGTTPQTNNSTLSIAASSLGTGQTGRSTGIAGVFGEEGNGGGGGGYYGGLAKRNTGADSDSGGGGGSGWVDPTSGAFSDIGGTRGVNAGDGRVQFTYLGP